MKGDFCGYKGVGAEQVRVLIKTNCAMPTYLHIIPYVQYLHQTTQQSIMDTTANKACCSEGQVVTICLIVGYSIIIFVGM